MSCPRDPDHFLFHFLGFALPVRKALLKLIRVPTAVTTQLDVGTVGVAAERYRLYPRLNPLNYAREVV